jgi:hypothetical protein
VSTIEPTSRTRRPRPSGRWRLVRVLLAVGVAALLFLLGIAFSRALDERPRTGEPVTTVQTVPPRAQEPPARTVTETVTQP